MLEKSFCCFIGAGYSFVAGVPLAKDLLSSNYILIMSKASNRRLGAVREHYEGWQAQNPGAYSEQYLSDLYAGLLSDAPPWKWAVEYISTAIASAVTPAASLNRDPRYSNRLNRPSRVALHRRFWQVINTLANEFAILTTNYDILIERALRHRPMQRPSLPGCYYAGVPRPQRLIGASQPFSRWSPERLVEMTGSVPVFKLHGSLNWSLEEQNLIMYQDLRAVYRKGGNAAIVPPTPEKSIPYWLKGIWSEAESALQNSNIWIICGYSMPAYDTEILQLLRNGSAGKCRRILLLDPHSESLRARWKEIAPKAKVLALPGLPEGIEALFKSLA